MRKIFEEILGETKNKNTDEGINFSKIKLVRPTYIEKKEKNGAVTIYAFYDSEDAELFKTDADMIKSMRCELEIKCKSIKHGGLCKWLLGD